MKKFTISEITISEKQKSAEITLFNILKMITDEKICIGGFAGSDFNGLLVVPQEGGNDYTKFEIYEVP